MAQFKDDTDKIMANLAACKPNLKQTLMKLIGVIALYISHSDLKDKSCLSLKDKRSNKLALSATLAKHLMVTTPNSLKEFCMTMTLVRPSWLAALVMTAILINGKQEEFKVGDSNGLDSDLEKILRHLPVKPEVLREAHPAIIMCLLDKLLATYPVHVMARTMLKDKGALIDDVKLSLVVRRRWVEPKKKLLKNLCLKYHLFRDPEKTLKEMVRFDNDVAITTEDLMNDLKTCIDVMNRLQLTDGKLQIAQWKMI